MATPRDRDRPGLSILEVLLGATWAGFGRPSADAHTRCRLLQEARLAAASLARDLGGSLPEPSGRLGAKADGVFVGRRTPDASTLQLCYHGGPTGDLTPQ